MTNNISSILLKPGSIFFTALFLITILFGGRIYASEKSVKGFSTIPWSVRMVESEMIRHSVYPYTWGYVEGTFLKGVEELWRTTGDNRYFQYIQNSLNDGFYNDGSLKSYTFSDYSLDEICEGRILLLMHKERINETKYQNAIETLRQQIREQPRVTEGGFWHRDNKQSNAYPNQMWLDGVYMANPFYAEYGKLFNEPADYDDVITQLTVMENHARDAVTGLLYHGWDESKTQAWANLITGCSPSFWGRAIGWYAMAVVDVLDYLPSEHPGRQIAIEILKRLAEAIKKVQDPIHGTWYQVLDKSSWEGNYRESSASCMFVYTLAKSIRLGYIDQSYWDVVKKGYTGILDEFITTRLDSTIDLIQTCATAGLGGNPYRDGTFDYYVGKTHLTTIDSNDGKATGPFILASLELEKTGFVVPPLNVNTKINLDGTITISWTDKSYNAVSFIIEKSIDGENYTQIGSVNKGYTSYINAGSLIAQTKYYYRVKAVSSTSSSDYSNVSSIIATDIKEEPVLKNSFQLNQNYPNPFNPSTVISYKLQTSGYTSLKISDSMGREVLTLVNGLQQAGTYNYQLTTINLQLSSGVYFYQLRSNNFIQTKKMMLLK